MKESIGNDDLSGSDVDPKHGNEPSFQQHSMVPGPYPPGMRRMGAMGPRSVPPWVGRGTNSGGSNSSSPYSFAFHPFVLSLPDLMTLTSLAS